MTTVVDKNHRVSFPADLAAALHLKPGMLLDWQQGAAPGVFTVVALPDRAAIAESLLGAGCKHLRSGQDPIAELVAEREREEHERNSAL